MREEEQPESLLWVTGELGSPTVKPPLDTRSPEGGDGGGEMDLVGGNKPVEVSDPEDSSTMEESVVTFSGQRRKEPWWENWSCRRRVWGQIWKREDAVLDIDIYHLERNGPGKMQDRIQRMFPRGKGWRPRSSERGTPNPRWDTGPSHRRVLGRAWER